MDSNKDEAERCIQLAEKYIVDRNREKAEKFLMKAERLYPSQKAKELLIQISLLAPNKSEYEQPRKRNVVPKAEETASPAVEYTPEQEQTVKRIQQCNNLYEILGVRPDAAVPEIKKAYKKLALQMHPDKNKCPGASEAFKILGNAAAVLTDKHQRQEYDMHEADPRKKGKDHSKFTGHQYYETDATAEELLNMFFGGGTGPSSDFYFRPPGGRWRRQTASSTQHDNRSRQREQQNSYTVFIQLLPILLAIMLSMASSFFISDPAYSLQSSSKYPVLRKTQNLQIPYYVKENFHTEYQGSVRRLEQSVEEEYISNLSHACYRERNYRESMIWKARSFGDKELFQNAQNIKLPSCDQLQNIRNRG